MFLVFSVIGAGSLLGMEVPSQFDPDEYFSPDLAARVGQLRQEDLTTTLDLRNYERINRRLLEELGNRYPYVQSLTVNAPSMEDEGYAGITPKLADTLVTAFPYLKRIQILECDFSKPLISGLTRLSMLRTGDAKIVVEHTQKCENQALK